MFKLFYILSSSCCGGISTGIFWDWFYNDELVFGIKKYAVCLLAGIIAAYLICTPEGERMGIKRDDVLQIAIITVPLTILGARIYYMLTDGVATFAGYKETEGAFNAIFCTLFEMIGFSKILGKWQFVGISGIGMFGVIVVTFIMVIVACRWKKWKFKNFVDMVAPGLLIGQIIGRWGNFFNREAHGTVVGGWNVVDGELVAKLTQAEQYDKLINTWHIPKFIANNMCMANQTCRISSDTWLTLSGYNYYHPTFLYESLMNLIGLILYFILRRNKHMRSGQFGALYMIWYGIVRIIIEIFRTDALYISGTSIKAYHLLMPIMIVIGIALFIYFRFNKKSELYMDAIKMDKKESDGSSSESDNEEETVVVMHLEDEPPKDEEKKE